MGFDLFIHLKLMMCPETGKPFYFAPNLDKVYEIPIFTVPENLRGYLQGRGSFFRAYTDEIQDDNAGCEVSLDALRDAFPSFEDVKQHIQYCEDWTEDDHTAFRDLIDYLLSLGYPFSVSWSY